MSEADYLHDIGLGQEAEDNAREERQNQYYDKIYKMQARYDDNKRSATGTTIRCAYCGSRILKNNYQTQFCSNKGKGNHKDLYWNNVNDKRRFRAQRYS